MAELTIKELCEEFNIGQSALARRFKIPLRTVQHWHSVLAGRLFISGGRSKGYEIFCDHIF